MLELVWLIQRASNNRGVCEQITSRYDFDIICVSVFVSHCDWNMLLETRLRKLVTKVTN